MAQFLDYGYLTRATRRVGSSLAALARAPEAPVNLQEHFGSVRSNTISLSWNANPDPAKGVSEVRLERLDERWLDEVADLVADPDVRRFTRIAEPPPEGFARTWIASYEAGRRDGSREGFAVFDADGRFVGLGLAPGIDRAAGELELGYIVARAARGRGVATEILRLLTRWAFEEAEAQRVYLIIDVDNPASARVAERCGYRLEGVMRSIHVKQGQRADAGLWSRLPGDPYVVAGSRRDA